MATLKIASFNIKNCNNKKEKISNAKILVDIIKKEKIDILGTQELTRIYEKELTKKLENYKCYGNYRLGNLFFKNNKYNENNIIITRKNVFFHKTIWLPWIANNFNDLKKSIIKKSIMPRIATTILINDKLIGKIRVINTHIDHKIPTIKQMQLNKIKKLIEKSEKKYPVILTGDFNMQSSDDVFQNFINDLENLNMKKVEIKESTWSGKNGKTKIIDHIFVPSSWKIINKGILDNEGISDHNPVFVEVEIKEKRKFKDILKKLKKRFK